MNLSPIRPHYLLKVDAAEVILTDGRDIRCIPSWVFRELRETSLVVVRRGVVTRNRIPIGIRDLNARRGGPHRIRRMPSSK